MIQKQLFFISSILTLSFANTHNYKTITVQDTTAISIIQKDSIPKIALEKISRSRETV
jgi:hypothetical protein